MNNQILYISLGLIPSIIWLFYYLRKDTHPEPSGKILEIFLRGALAAIIAALIETTIIKNVGGFNFLYSLNTTAYMFLLISFIEETSKYLVIRKKAFQESEFDEPLDAIVYMIISALGFAALENILLFFSESLEPSETLLIATLRFGGATLLHALCSGIFGYFIALSFSKSDKKYLFFLMGLVIVVFLHALYNFSIIQLDQEYRLIIPTIILGFLAIFLSLGIKHTKKLKSICELE